ncbi:hypothetical protein SAMN05216262_10853 [Colwellia chukchiensis]|uniref:Uncharacterized protein n=1 Tax=Colwellia chukchiensis TaxID=641665 RepID=A0A1H7NPZ1_9GAMM|nr:hypothetical protein SAMN05216262_10853 [Colwellia chukchiensis]
MFIGAMDGVDCRVKGRFSAGINFVPKFCWNVLLSWGSVGFQGDAGGSIPLGVVASATASCVALTPASMQSTATPSRKIKRQAVQFTKLDPTYSNLASWSYHTGLVSGCRLHPEGATRRAPSGLPRRCYQNVLLRNLIYRQANA